MQTHMDGDKAVDVEQSEGKGEEGGQQGYQWRQQHTQRHHHNNADHLDSSVATTPVTHLVHLEGNKNSCEIL